MTDVAISSYGYHLDFLDVRLAASCTRGPVATLGRTPGQASKGRVCDYCRLKLSAGHLYGLLKEAPAVFISERISGDCLQRALPMRTLTAASADAMSCSRKVSLGSSSPSATIGIVGPSCSSRFRCTA